jgi:hypothetical protein
MLHPALIFVGIMMIALIVMILHLPTEEMMRWLFLYVFVALPFYFVAYLM